MIAGSYKMTKVGRPIFDAMSINSWFYLERSSGERFDEWVINRRKLIMERVLYEEATTVQGLTLNASRGIRTIRLS